MVNREVFRIDDEQEQDKPKDKAKWISTTQSHVMADATNRSEYMESEDGATILPLVLEYGDGLPGKKHPYGDIKTGRAYEGQGVDNAEAEVVEVGTVEPATRAWEDAPADTMEGFETIEPLSDTNMSNTEFLEKIVTPKKVLRYTLKGKSFGTYNGAGERIGMSTDGEWLGIVYSESDAEYIPPADPDQDITLTVADKAHTVRFTGIVLPVGDKRRVMIFYKL